MSIDVHILLDAKVETCDALFVLLKSTWMHEDVEGELRWGQPW